MQAESFGYIIFGFEPVCGGLASAGTCPSGRDELKLAEYWGGTACRINGWDELENLESAGD